MSRFVTLCVIALALAVAACGSDSKTACDPAAQTGCGTGAVCEQVQNGPPACFEPVVVAGKVFDLAAPTTAIAQARVVALDANRAPVSAVALTGTDGTYQVQVPQMRRADGSPAAGGVTLRVDHAGYQTFPGGVRIALPIDTSAATHANGAWTVQSSLTDVGLVALPSGAATASVHGKVALPPGGGGVLVVAQPAAGGPGTTGIADLSGNYAIFNLPVTGASTTYAIQAYARGANYKPATQDLAAGANPAVDLAIQNTTTATVTGSVNPVAGASGLPTSVILVLKSTFDANLGRGDSPPGLRDPASGLGVTNGFSIAGVPDGDYIALAAFEDDGLVRDVAKTGGTLPLEIQVANGAMTTAPGSFKVTTAVTLVSPGANGPQEGVASPPQFTWVSYPATATYGVTVYDTFGNVLWTYTVQNPPSSGNVSVTYGQAGGTPATAPGLTSGMYYQVLVESFGQQTTQYSRTEDLKGVFSVK